jgi:hypothetical protein
MENQNQSTEKSDSRDTPSTEKKNNLSTQKEETMKQKEEEAIKEKPQKRSKKTPTKKKANKYYYLGGEITVNTVGIPIERESPSRIETPEIVIDPKGNAFGKAAVEAVIDGKKSLIALEARQVELLLKLLRIVPYEKEEASNK